MSNGTLCEPGVPNCCFQDFDCSDSLICIDEPVWTFKKNFCQCSLWYGWWGKQCQWWGPTSFFLLFAIVAAVSILTNLLYGNFVALYKLYWTKEKLITHHGKITLILSTFGAYFMLQWRIIELINLASPNEHVTRSATGDGLNQVGGDAKMQKIVVGSRLSVLLLGFFVCQATFNLPLLWLEKAETSGLEYWLPKIRLLQYGFTIIVIIILSAGRIETVAAIALTILAVLGIIVGYIRRRYRTEIQYHKLSAYVNGAMITLMLASVFTLIYTIYFVIGWKRYNPADKISTFVVYNEGMIFSIIGTLVVMYKTTVSLAIFDAPPLQKGKTRFGATAHSYHTEFSSYEEAM